MLKSFYQTNKKTIFIILGLFSLFMLFFYGLNSYYLIDVDETRYVSMAREMLERKNWHTLFLNGNYFFEKPPLYFWILAVMFKFFGGASEFIARFSMALIATFGVGYLYYFAQKTVSKTFGVISALILSTTLFYLMLSHIAILDIVLSVFIITSILSGFLVLFVQEKNRKYCWFLAYLFSGLAIMAKGIPGLAIPALTLFFVFLATKNLKELFKPTNLLMGIIILSAIVLPWHIIMCKMYGSLFIDEYFIKHHLSRFVNSENLGRKQPFLFYVPIIIGGIFPWTFVLVSYLIKAFKNGVKKIKGELITSVFNTQTNQEKVIMLSWIWIAVVFFFFSISSTKLPTYILPIFAPCALLLANYWNNYIYNNEHNKSFKYTNLSLSIFLFLGAIALLIVPMFLKGEIAFQLRELSVFVITFFTLIGFLLLYLDKNKKKEELFALHILLAVLIVFVCIKDVTQIVISGGENQLIEYAQFVKKIPNAKLYTYNFGVRPSVLYYYGKKVEFLTETNDIVKQNLENELSSATPVYVIVKNKNNDFDLKYSKIIKEGTKYSLLSN